MTGDAPDRTYRDLPNVMGPVDVERPEWAQQYAVGDEIAFEAPPDGAVRTATVVGFSSLENNRGRPVILPDDRLASQFDCHVDQVVVTEEHHVSPSEVPDRD